MNFSKTYNPKDDKQKYTEKINYQMLIFVHSLLFTHCTHIFKPTI
ncbi:hypothetical protein Flavo103_13930 [Flavobacterium collinsii]|nr:hypothetical protein Flavo103_13930 [Flavobacterium collinsii]